MRRIVHTISAITCLIMSLAAWPAAATQGAGTQSIGAGLECSVYPYLTYPPVYSDYCQSSRPSYSSTVRFRVIQPVAGNTYSWSLSGATLPSTCTTTSSVCDVSVSTRGHDRYLIATVVVSDGIQSASYTAEALAAAACPGPTGVEFC